MATASNFCEIVKANLNLDATYTQAGLLESLISGANVQAGAFQPIESRGNGKKKTQLVRYMSPVLASSVEAGVLGTDPNPTFCDGDIANYKEEQFEVNNFAHVSQTISAYDMASFCEGTNTVVMDVIKSMIRQLVKSVDTQLIALYDNVRGKTSAGNGTPISGLAFSDYANLAASPAIMDAISSEFFALDVTGRPIVVGGQILDQYSRAAGIGCCNNFGQEVSSFAGNAALFTDTSFNAANLGAAPANNDWFVYPAGTVQLLDWNLADNSRVAMGSGDLVSSTVIEIPVGEQENFSVDLDVTYDECNKVWAISLTKYFGLMHVPADYFNVGDEYEGVNYMLRFRPTTA